MLYHLWRDLQGDHSPRRTNRNNSIFSTVQDTVGLYESLFLRFTDKNSYSLSSQRRLSTETGTAVQSECAFCRRACHPFSPYRELGSKASWWRESAPY